MSGAPGASIVAFARIPGMIDDMAADMMSDVTEVIPGEIDAALPELPTTRVQLCLSRCLDTRNPVQTITKTRGSQVPTL